MMDDFIKFNNQTAGRDKVFRLLQYCSRIVWYNLERRGKSPEGVQKAKKLDETLGLMRRLLRFGRVVDTLHSALPVMAVNDTVIRFTSSISRISSACFMAIDHFVCLHKLGLVPQNFMDAGAWDKTSTRFWLYSIVMGLVRDVYEILKIYNEACQVRKRKYIKGHSSAHRNSQQQQQQHEESVGSLKHSNKKGDGLSIQLNPTVRHCIISIKIASQCLSQHADITIDFVKNVCDLFIPLTVLGYVKLSPGKIGLLGIISTLASSIPQINPMLKIVPAC